MTDHVQFSVATSAFCRIMQLATLAAIGFVIYIIMQNPVSEQVAWASYGQLTQDQANLVIVSDAKTELLKNIVLASRLTPILLLLGIFRVFGRFASRPFRLNKAGQVIRFLGLMSILKALVDFAIHPATMYAMTYDNPVGTRALAFGFHPEHLTWLLLGIALMVAGNLTRSAAVAGMFGAGDALDEAEDDLAEAEEELEEAYEELAEAEADLAAAETPEAIEEALEEIAEAKDDIAEAVADIAEAESDIAAAKAAIVPPKPEKT